MNSSTFVWKETVLTHAADFGEVFRRHREMVNKALELLRNGAKPRDVYREIKDEGLHSKYVSDALRRARWILRSPGRSEVAKFHGSVVVLHPELVKVGDGWIRVTVGPGRKVYVPLRLHKHARPLFDGWRKGELRMGSIILRPSVLAVPFRKEVRLREVKGYAFHDLNENCIATLIVRKDGSVERFVEEFREVLRIRITYQLKRRRLFRLGRKDLLRKYRRREWRKVRGVLHEVSKRIVGRLAEEGLAQVMGDLRGIGRKWVKGKALRRRLKAWSYAVLARMLEYKLAWEGLPTYYVNEAGTSSTCPRCGARARPQGRRFACAKCGFEEDRHIVGALNIARKFLEKKEPELVEALKRAIT